jgi:Short C-terminal domain
LLDLPTHEEDANRTTKGVYMSEATGTDIRSLADELKILSDLRDSGILTEWEFAQQKKKLL